MIGIITKYLPATNHRGSRIKATIFGNRSITIPYPYHLSDEMVHFEAVKAVLKKYGITEVSLENMRYGGIDNGYCFCFNHSIVGA